MKRSWADLRDNGVVLVKGTRVRVKLVTYGHPVVETTVSQDTPFNYAGLMRVDVDGRQALAIYPPLDIM